MNYFEKVVIKNWRFFQKAANHFQGPIINTRVHRVWKKPCQILIQTESGNSYRDHKSRGTFRDRSNFLLPAGGVLMSLFKWGDEEEDPIPELIMTLKRSIWLIQKEDYKKAEQMLHVALRQAQALQHYEGITYVYDIMANLAFEVGDYKKANTLFVSVMQRLISTGTPKDDIKIVHISLKMAKLFQHMGDLEKAEQGYEFCLKSLQDQMEKEPENEDVLVLWAMSCDWYAKMLLSQSKFGTALKNIEQAYKVCLKVHGREHEQTVVLLNDLGTISCLAGDDEQAINYLTSAAEIGTKLPDMQDLGAVHVNLGGVYLKKGLYNEAKKFCEEGRKIATTRNNQECLDEANECLKTVKQFLKT
ncbi:tetratricopeptide repeat protein 19 homolog, mitochondrial [Venturia canescens]|uniref:tetratricopeptide repeat protein 19 homolog, mitochondrial n=1 Tax=Venturia canescens TaxID=32260 RepID=UPI001C9C6F27|nr:tetratricopeptide repeat protein 19 homolog, mitochondrial [Venturia canescens]